MKVTKETFALYSIAEEGLMSSENVGEGRMIPVLVIDIKDNKAIEDLLKIHKDITAGDVTMTWSQKFYDRSYFILKMEFTKPMEIVFGIQFKIEKEYSLVDGIMQSKGFYLQTGVKGDKISKKMEDPKILIEVPDMGVKDIWNKILLDTLKKKYKKQGYKRREATSISKQHISEMRKFWKMRR